MTSLEWRFIFKSRRTLIFIMCVFVASYIILYRIQEKENKKLVLPIPVRAFNYHAYSIYTNGCKIHYLDPLDDTIQQFILPPAKPLICPSKHADIVYPEDDWLRFNMTSMRSFKNVTYCKYAAIIRIGDTSYKYTTDKKAFIEDIQVDDEFIKVTCFNNSHDNIYQKLFAFVLLNHTTEESRKRLFQEYKKTEKPLEILNVLMLGVDGMSRSNFIRQMPKSISYLKTELGAVDFHGYNKIGSDTFHNIVPILSGKSVKDLPWSEKEDLKKPFDNYTLLWKLFSATGYSTMFAEESESIFNYLRRGFDTQPTDYYLRPFQLALDQDGDNSHKHCIGDKQNTERVLDYLWDGLQMFKKFEIPHFSFTFIHSLSHSSLNNPSLGDHLYESFLKKYKTLGHCNNTILVLFSDHGPRFGAIRQTKVGKFEGRSPGLFLVVPPWFHQRYPKSSRNLHINSRRLVTALDVHETLKNVLGFNGRINEGITTGPGISLFSEIPDTRTCGHVGIPLQYCSCFETTNLPVFDNRVISATNATLHWINTLTHEYRNICAEFEIKKVLMAEVLKFENMITYQVTFEVNPSEGIFESTVKTSGGKWIVIGDVIRSNRYGSQSECVNKLSLKEFCFCVL